MIKPGYRTSEFWFTFVSFIFSGLYLVGIIGENGQKEDLIRDVSHGVESCILIGGQLFILYKYIKGRSTVKKAFTEQKVENEPAVTKSRSRKTSKSNKRVNTKRPKNSPKWGLENITTNNSNCCTTYREYSKWFSWKR